MPDSKDYRLYLEQRFIDLTTLMNARFNTVDDDNEAIKSHLKELNGTVRDHTSEISDLKVSDELHIADCPIIPEIKAIQTNLTEYNFIKSHPNVMFIVLAVMVASLIIGTIGTIKAIGNGTKSTEIKQSVDGIRYELAPLRGEINIPLDSNEVIKRMK